LSLELDCLGLLQNEYLLALLLVIVFADKDVGFHL